MPYTMASTAATLNGALLAAMCFVLLHSSMGQQPVPASNCQDHYAAPTPVSTPPTSTSAPLAPTLTPAPPPPTPASTPPNLAPAPSAPTLTPAAPPPTPVSIPLPNLAPAPSVPTPTPAAPPPPSDCSNSCPSLCNTSCTNYRDAGLRRCDAEATAAFTSCYDSCTSRTCPGKSCVHSGCTLTNCTCDNANARSCCETCGRATSSVYFTCITSVDGGSHMYYCMRSCISSCKQNCV